MRLRTLLALTFAAGAFAMTLAATAVVAHFIEARARVRIERLLTSATEHLRQRLAADLAERLADIQVLAVTASVAQASPEAARTWVEAVRDATPAFAWIGLTDTTGRVTASTDGLLTGASVAERPWFRAGLAGPVAEDVHEAKLLASRLPGLPDGEPWRFIDVAMPLRSASGGVTGVIGGHLSLSWMRELGRTALVPSIASQPGVSVLILAGDGTVVLGPGERQGGRLFPDLAVIRALGQGAEHATGIERWPDGRDYITAASRPAAGTDRTRLAWTIIVRQPVEIAFVPARTFVRQFLAWGIAFAACAALLGWWLAERIAAPLHRLAGAANRIRDTSSAAALPPARGYTEIAEVTGALHALMARLGEHERLMAAANAELEERVAERTGELARARDRALNAQGRAEAGERAKSAFLATMSHEIRTPLNAIKGFGDLLGDEAGLTPLQRRYVDRMRVGCEVLTTVVDDILDMASVEAGKVVLDRVPFRLAAFVEETAALAQAAAEQKGLALRVEAEGAGDVMVRGDVIRLRQVLLNLVNNAIKFTPAGTVTVALAQAEEPDGIGVRVRVRDTGIGIPGDVQGRLFQRFAQADGSTRRRFGGTGLGLAIAKGLIEAMGGTIGLESREGEGSTFWFAVTLPRAEEGAAAIPSAAPGVPAPLGETRRPHLLLVEDLELNREIAQAVLEDMGYRVDVACDGREAVGRVLAQRYDLVLMDVEMPVMDGADATRCIRSLDGPAQDVPIVMMTAHVLPELVAQLREAGADEHVGKPFERAHLRAVIDRCLAASRAQGPAAARVPVRSGA